LRSHGALDPFREDSVARFIAHVASDEFRGEMVELGAALRGEMGELGVALRGEMGELGVALRGEMVELGVALRGEMADLGTELGGEIVGPRTEMSAMEKRLTLELAKAVTDATNVFAEHTRQMIGVIDDKYRDVPAQVVMVRRDLDAHREDRAIHVAPKRRSRKH
jgi:hypothetical protein